MTRFRSVLHVVVAGVVVALAGCDEESGGTPKRDASADGSQGIDTSENRPATAAMVTNDAGTTTTDGPQEVPHTDGGQLDSNGSCFQVA